MKIQWTQLNDLHIKQSTGLCPLSMILKQLNLEANEEKNGIKINR